MTKTTARPRLFLDISIGTEPAGRLTVELFTDKTPKTCENFRVICTSSKAPLSYRLSHFHRIIDEFMVQGGDITKADGTGGKSIYGGEFEDENLGWRALDSAGLLCMANRGKGTNTSQFFITLDACEHLNGKHTIFGHLIAGHETLQRMAKVQVDGEDKPLTDVIISNCGELHQHRAAQVEDEEEEAKSEASENVILESETDNTSTRKRRRTYSSPVRQRRSHSRSRSRSDSRSPSRHNRHDSKHRRRSSRSPNRVPPAKDRQRRRSDHVRDETRRGRELRKSSATPVRESPDGIEEKVERHRKKRSPSPSRGPRKDQSREDETYRRRPSLPNHYRRYHGQENSSIYDGRRSRYGNRENRDGDRGSRGRVDESRLDGGTWEDGEGTNEGRIKFKGRGSMKYRERQANR